MGKGVVETDGVLPHHLLDEGRYRDRGDEKEEIHGKKEGGGGVHGKKGGGVGKAGKGRKKRGEEKKGGEKDASEKNADATLVRRYDVWSAAAPGTTRGAPKSLSGGLRTEPQESPG